MKKLLAILVAGSLVGCSDWFSRKAQIKAPNGYNYQFAGTSVPMGALNSVQAPTHFSRVVGLDFAPNPGFNTPTAIQSAYQRVKSVMPAFGRVQELNANVLFAYLSAAEPVCEGLVQNGSAGFWSLPGNNPSILNGTAVSAPLASLGSFITNLSGRAWGYSDPAETQIIVDYATHTAADFDSRFPSSGRRELIKSVCMIVLTSVSSIGS